MVIYILCIFVYFMYNMYTYVSNAYMYNICIIFVYSVYICV